MTPERYRQVSVVFDKAARCEPDRRAAVLAEACDGDPDLRAQVERMLAADADATRESFLDVPTNRVTPSSPITEGPGDRVGPYKILQPLGEGGMGEVFLAEQGEPVRRRVALKLIKPGMDSAQVIARFAAERQALAILDHPNIAKVLDAGAAESGRPYFVMELVKGVPITEYCDRNKLTPRQRLELFIPVCRAIQHAHQKGIIHRDIKPSNVLVTLVDGEPVAKVIDFGVAKAIDQRLTEQTIFTQMGDAVGTLEYMSPEQADLSALDVDTRSDVYSLGVLLYELLTGTTPLERAKLRAAGYVEIVRRIKEEEPPKPSTRLSNSGDRRASIAACRGAEPARLSKLLRGELDWIAMKALEKDRTRRYETANGLARDIERYLEGQAVEAGPPSARYKLSRFARRHRAALATAGAFALLLVAAATGSTYLAVRARQAESAAKKAKAATELALKESEESRQEAQAVSMYLVEAFRKPDPRLDGRALKVVDLLDQAVAKLDERFAGSPKIKGDLLDALGETYLGLGLGRQAVDVFTKARALREVTSGPDHSDTLTSRHKLASAYMEAGRTADAIALHEETLKLCESKLGKDHPETLASRHYLGTAYNLAGRASDAIAMHKETLRLREARLGLDHADTLKTRQNLGAAYDQAGRTSESIDLDEQTVKIREAKLGRDHPDTLTSRSNLAVAYYNSGRTPDAIALHEQTLKLREAKLGKDHPDTLRSRFNLGTSFIAAGRSSDAIAILVPTLELMEARLGKDHPDSLRCRDWLAWAYARADRKADAIVVHEQTLKRREAKLGEDHPDTLASRTNLAEAYRAASRMSEAIAQHEHTLKLREAKLGEDHPDTLVSRSHLAETFREMGRTAEAIALHEQTLKLREAKLGKDSLDTLDSFYSLAETYVTAGRGPEAIALHQKTIEHLVANPGELAPDRLMRRRFLTSTRYSLGWALIDQKKPEEAAVQFRETVRLDGNHVGEAPFALGAALRQAGRYAEAVDVFRDLPRRIHDDTAKSERAREELAKRASEELTSAERRAALADRLPAVIRGDEKPKDAAEELTFAHIAYETKRFGPSARLFNLTFQSNPALAEDMTAQHRYNAACAASLAAAGQGDEKPSMTEPQKSRWRKQALDWLRADLTHWTKLARSALNPDEAKAKQTLRHWKTDADLASIRDEATLKRLPRDDRRACRSLWGEVDTLLLDPMSAIAHYDRGRTLYQDKPEEAIAEFREAMRLDGDHVGEAPFALGWILCRVDRFEEALDLFRDLRERVRDDPELLERALTQLAAMERQAALAARLPAVIRGDLKPTDAAEGLAFAYLAYRAKRFVAAARLYAAALQSDPKLAEDMTAHNRYNAACAAALAAAGKGDDQPPLSEPERSRWRKQALDWLEADLAHWTKQAQSGPPQTDSMVQKTLVHWKADADLAAIRDEESLKSLPEDEPEACRSLWADVDALLKTAAPL